MASTADSFTKYLEGKSRIVSVTSKRHNINIRVTLKENVFSRIIQRDDKQQRAASQPELLPEVGAEVLCQLVVVLQTRQQEATALEQQDRLGRTQQGAVQVRQGQHHLLGLMTDEGHLQRDEDTEVPSLCSNHTAFSFLMSGYDILNLLT